MRRVTALALLTGLVFSAPAVTAHAATGPALNHVQVKLLQLDSGANETVWIETGEGPWQAGMVFVLFLSFFNESRNVEAELLFNHSEVVESWSLLDEKVHKASVRLPFDQGPYELRFTNRATQQTQLFFYFDQTCNCVSKPIPLDDGLVVFHYDLKGGRTYEIGTPVPAQWKLRAVLALPDGEDGVWPADFEILQDVTLQGAPYWINFTVAPDDDARHFIFYEALEGSPTFPDPERYVEVTPRLQDVTGADGGDSPAFTLLTFVVAFAVAGLSARPRRR